MNKALNQSYFLSTEHTMVSHGFKLLNSCCVFKRFYNVKNSEQKNPVNLLSMKLTFFLLFSVYYIDVIEGLLPSYLWTTSFLLLTAPLCDVTLGAGLKAEAQVQ